MKTLMKESSNNFVRRSAISLEPTRFNYSAEEPPVLRRLRLVVIIGQKQAKNQSCSPAQQGFAPAKSVFMFMKMLMHDLRLYLLGLLLLILLNLLVILISLVLLLSVLINILRHINLLLKRSTKIQSILEN